MLPLPVVDAHAFLPIWEFHNSKKVVGMEGVRVWFDKGYTVSHDVNGKFNNWGI